MFLEESLYNFVPILRQHKLPMASFLVWSRSDLCDYGAHRLAYFSVSALIWWKIQFPQNVITSFAGIFLVDYKAGIMCKMKI